MALDFKFKRVASEIEITKYTGSATYERIPSSIEGCHVTSIGQYAFYSCSSTTIIIPDSVSRIDDYAFSSCDSLTNVIIPDSVRYIGEYAFANCTSLKSIVLPATNINKYAFYGCVNLLDIYYSKRLVDTSFFIIDPYRKNRPIVHYYNFPSKFFQRITDSLNIDKLIERIEKTLNNIHYLKNLPAISSELLASTKQTENLLEYSHHLKPGSFYNSVEKILADIETEYNRQYKIKSNSGLPTKLIMKAYNLEMQLYRMTEIPAELLALIKQIKDLDAKDYPQELNDSVAKVLSDIETEYNRQYEISQFTLPTELSRKVSRLENEPAISAELLALIKQIKDLGAKDYSPELNDSVTKILADIETEYNRQQEKISVINLIALVESVSGKQITNTPQYVQKFDDEVADFVSNINAAIAALRTKKIAIQNRLSEQKRENEDLINAAVEALKTEKISMQNRLSEQKRENENRISAELEALKASLKE